jgi:hypothetical protein
MRRRNSLFVAAACTAILAVALVRLMRTQSKEPEPTYEGRTLSQWMATNAISAVSGDISTSDKAEEAIRKIGTNAIPFLLRWIAEEPPIPPGVAAKLPASVTQNRAAQLVIDGPHNERAFDSTYAFSILGKNAITAVPQLKLLMADTNRPVTASRATTALSYIVADLNDSDVRIAATNIARQHLPQAFTNSKSR